MYYTMDQTKVRKEGVSYSTECSNEIFHDFQQRRDAADVKTAEDLPCPVLPKQGQVARLWPITERELELLWAGNEVWNNQAVP